VSVSILEVQHITKEFPGVKALDDVSFSVRQNEVHALVGENGAGKSTLMKILNGNYIRDAGTILFDGEAVEIKNPKEAKKLGISIIFQELNLVPQLSVAENIYMDRLPKKGLLVDWPKLYSDTKAALARIGYDLDPKLPTQELSVAQKQMLELARALSYENTKLVLMDEPTATLTNQECKVLFEVIHRLKEQGITVIYISHRLEELFEVCDRLTILRDGKYEGTMAIEEATVDSITAKMIGREITEKFPKRDKGCVTPQEMLRVENLGRQGIFEDISFTLYQGEVLGLAGLVGAGRTEIARAIFGIDYRDSGDIYIKGKKVTIKDPAQAIDKGICYLSEDRKTEGLMGTLPVKWNITIANLAKVLRAGLLNTKKENEVADATIKTMNIKTPTRNQIAFNLSGGNQQKVVVGKWLNTEVDVFIFDEPTRGIDVGAKYEIYLLINELVEQGKSVIMISSELPEIMGMSDRLLVVRGGRIAAEFDADDMTAQDFITNAI